MGEIMQKYALEAKNVVSWSFWITLASVVEIMLFNGTVIHPFYLHLPILVGIPSESLSPALNVHTTPVSLSTRDIFSPCNTYKSRADTANFKLPVKIQVHNIMQRNIMVVIPSRLLRFH